MRRNPLHFCFCLETAVRIFFKIESTLEKIEELSRLVMGRKKSEFSSDNPSNQSIDEELSTTEELDDNAMETTIVKTEDVDVRVSTEEVDEGKSDAPMVVLPKKRGRKPKHFHKIAKKHVVDQMGHGEIVVKRKRGRPRKYGIPNGTNQVPMSTREPIPRILLNTFQQDLPRRRRGRPRKYPLVLTTYDNTVANTNANSNNDDDDDNNESRLGSQVDRLASLVDRLENRINLDGLIDEDTDIESEQEVDKQIFLLQRNFNVKLDVKQDFKAIVKSYLEDLGAVQGCLIASVRSYKDTGRIILYEIWESEVEQLEFTKGSSSKIFEKEASEMLKSNTVVKNMSIPARWWQQRTS